MPAKHSRNRNKSDILHTPVLVLNASFEPVNIVTVKRAMVLLSKEAAAVQDNSDRFLHTAHHNVPVPSVIRLLRYRYVPRRTQPISRKGVFLRDGFICQFCLVEFPANELTLDHVIPRSKGGPTSWGNIVACCYACNNRKADRDPDEAGMPLARRPAPLGLHAKHRLSAGSNISWDRYLFV